MDLELFLFHLDRRLFTERLKRVRRRGLISLLVNVVHVEGDPRSRDGAYHQGTVWPWLMGPFITTYVKTFGKKAGQRVAAE